MQIEASTPFEFIRVIQGLSILPDASNVEGDMMEVLFLWVSYALLAAVSILLVSLGEILKERSGVVNIGLEGIMLLGALAGRRWSTISTTSKVYRFQPACGLTAALVGILIGHVHGYVSAYWLAVK